MTFTFAPMEGVTSHVYRRVHAALFPGAARYYSPFIAPDGSGKYKAGNLRDILPENNRGLELVPQILCNSSAAFLAVAGELAAMGYREVNLNAGCPSGTVVPKHKGAGMLADPAALDRFLEEVFSRCTLSVSVKTRMGLADTGEFPALLEVYNKYPLSRLIVHARAGAGMYKSRPDREGFAAALGRSRAPVSYNGDVFSPEDLAAVERAAPQLEEVMVGRGAAANPALLRRLAGGAPLTAEELRNFMEALLAAYLSGGLGERYALARLKELWYYTASMFPGGERLVKSIKKAGGLPEYRSAVEALFASGLFSGEACFHG